MVFVGIVLSILGVFLPWGNETHPPGMFGSSGDDLLGIQLLPGTIAFISSVFTAAFFSLHMKARLRGSSVLALVFSIFTVFCLLTWILTPDAVGLYWGWWKYGLTLIIRDEPMYMILYGAYISFTGAVLTLASMISLRFLEHLKSN
jgi:hypothetical protein